MQKIASTLEDVLSILATDYTGARVIAIDGKDGSGKSTLAAHLGQALSVSVVSIDDHVQKHMGSYVPHLDCDTFRASVAAHPHKVVVEGICLLDALSTADIAFDALVYVKRMGDYGHWYDEKLCTPPDDVESFIEEQSRDLDAFARMKAHLEGRPEPEEPAQASPLSLELIRYHAKYRPYHVAHIIYERRDAA